MQLDEFQEKAVEMAIKERVMILTGGPGTGKTFTVQFILKTLQEQSVQPHKIALAAPTGKAARRMSEACFGWSTSTVHRLLEYSPQFGGFARNAKNPLIEDVIIVDESSMLDASMTENLLSAVRPGAKIICVGDKDQLPSVGPGNVLRDMIASGVLPVAELKKIHRQSEHSWISTNARLINSGQMPTIDPKSEDFFVQFVNSGEDATAAIVELVSKTIPKEFGFDPIYDIQVLCPQKKGPVGAHTLNEKLQEILNPNQPNLREFRFGDKVINVRNNYLLEVMNGETGTIVEMYKTGESTRVVVDFGDRRVEYDPSALEDLQLAYGLTIHKSQGSEWPAVVVPVHSTNFMMLSRNLFYTAITRARRAVWVVANHKGLNRAVKNDSAQVRHTRLDQCLREIMKQAA